MSNDALTTTSKSQRLLSLDVFRGLTILAMILVNNPGNWSKIYYPLSHAPWHGWTPTDLIFPFFLFIVGTSLAYSLRKYRDGAAIDHAVYHRILQRTAILFALGLFTALFGRTLAILFQGADSLHLETLRILGVLQRIALVYLAASLIALHVRLPGQVVIAAVLLAVYWAALTFLPASGNAESRLSPEGNVVRVIDVAVLTESHMYTQAKSERTEPEGLLSTLPAIVNALIGYWAGLFIQRRGANWNTVGTLLVAGVTVAAIGLLWGQSFPINKKLWTSSFVLLTSGLAVANLALCLAVFDIGGHRRLARAFEIVGVNAIFVFVGASLAAQTLALKYKPDASLKDWIYEEGFTDPIHDPYLASFAFALTTVAIWWIILWAMSRRGWSIRV